MKIYLIRHGLTESNKKNIYAGQNDEPLIQEGIPELNETARKLKELNVEKIYSSPIRRAVQTAETINRFLNLPIETEENLKEMIMGPWQGLSEQEVAMRFPQEWKTWNSKPSELRLNGRETLKELQIRALKALEVILDKSLSSRILAVTHVALIRVLMIHYNNLLLDDYRKIDVPNCSVFLLNPELKNQRIRRIH